MLITRSVGSVKEGAHPWVHYHIQCPLLCGQEADEPLILHNHTNGADELFNFPDRSVIVRAIHLESLL